MTDKTQSRHEHSAMSSRGFLDADRILKTIGLKKGDVFLDAGCGDGYFAITAAAIVGTSGRVYAVDIDETAITSLKKEIKERNISNIEAFAADITRNTPLASQIVDICLMSNVLHGFVVNREVVGAMKEVTRTLKLGATLAVVEFTKTEDTHGPPLSIRLAPQETAAIIAPYHYQQTAVIEAGAHHYAAIFRKK